MIKTSNLKYTYTNAGPIVFPDIEVPLKESMLIYGESGCGKTTFLHLLAGLMKPTEGSIFINEKNIASLNTAQMDEFRGNHIGIVYQKPYFIESLSVQDNLLLSPFSKKDKLKNIVSRLNIDGLLKRYPHQLSVGQQQRVGIARALINDPKVILADEPTSSLDNKNCKYVIDLLKEESANNDAALIITTHDDRLQSEINYCIHLDAVLS